MRQIPYIMYILCVLCTLAVYYVRCTLGVCVRVWVSVHMWVRLYGCECVCALYWVPIIEAGTSENGMVR